MYEATAQTLASPATTWAIVIIMSLVTAFLVAAPVVANTVQSKESKRDRAARGLAPGHGGAGLVPGEAGGAREGERPTQAGLPAQAPEGQVPGTQAREVR